MNRHDLELEMLLLKSRLQREGLVAVQARIAARQTGEAFDARRS